MDVNLTMLPEAVVIEHAGSRHAVLERLAEVFASVYGLDAGDVLEGLEQREKLGSTGFGRGLAIPHCRSEDVMRPTLALLRTEQPVEFGSADAVPASLFFGLVSPVNAGSTHLHALAAISRFARDEAMLAALGDAPDAEAMFAVLTNQLLRDAA